MAVVDSTLHDWLEPGMQLVREFAIPIRTYSNANQRQHWAKRTAQNKQQKADVSICTQAFLNGARLAPPIRVILTRMSTAVTPLDTDNLASSMKAVRDAICSVLGLDDGDRARIRFAYDEQTRRPEWGVRVQIYAFKSG